MTFNEWFEAEGFAEEFRDVAVQAWERAQTLPRGWAVAGWRPVLHEAPSAFMPGPLTDATRRAYESRGVPVEVCYVPTAAPRKHARCAPVVLRGEVAPPDGAVPFKPETWPVDADGFEPNLCAECGWPVRYGARHSQCGEAVRARGGA